MLLRSSSAPLLNSSWIHPVSACSSSTAYSTASCCCCSSSSPSPPPSSSCCNNSSAHGHGHAHPPPAPDNKEQIVQLCSTLFPRTNSLLSLASKSKPNPSSPDHSQTPILPNCCRSPKTQLITNYHQHHQFLLPAGNESPRPASEPQTASSSLDRLFSSSGLDAAVLEVVGGNNGRAVEEDNDNVRTTQEEPEGDCGGGSDEGGRIGFGGEGCRRSRSKSDGTDEPGYTDERAEAYHQRLIDADPGNPLLLTNYAKFLKEVRGDIAKAEEYCERAILVNPVDPILLALYADIIWTSKRDAHRAESYFDQAVKSSPSDCYVMASYAKFLWDTEEQEEDQGGGVGEEENQHRNNPNTNTNTWAFAWTGSSHTHPISATS